MKRFLWPVITLLVTAFLVALFSFPGGGALAFAAGHRPRPTPTPSPTPPPTPSPTPVGSGGVNFQTNGNLILVTPSVGLFNRSLESRGDL
jgi:hypothetical protein